MTKLLFTSGLILACLLSKGSSIVDTLPNKVEITKKQAEDVMRDLDRGEANKQIRNILEAQIIDYRAMVANKDSIIANYRTIQANSLKIADNLSLISKDWENRYKEERRARVAAVRWGRVSLVLLVGAVGYGVYKSLK